MQIHRPIMSRHKSLFAAISLVPLFLFSQAATAGDLRIFVGSGYGSSQGYHHDYRTRSGFALSYGVGGRFDRGHHDRHGHHNFKPYRYNFKRPHDYKPDKHHGYRGYGRPFSYYHDNAARYRHDYSKGYRHGYRDGRQQQRRESHHQLGP